MSRPRIALPMLQTGLEVGQAVEGPTQPETAVCVDDLLGIVKEGLYMDQ